MNSKYKILNYKSQNTKEIEDLISIEEPLEISIEFKQNDTFNKKTISVTMRTPGNDSDLVRGFLFNERIIEDIKHIEKIVSIGEKVGQYKLQNKILITLNNSENVDIDKIKRNFLTNSSCGVCGKTSLDSLEIIKNDKVIKSLPKISHELIMQSPSLLRKNQSEFFKTGGIHASGLFSNDGTLVAIREDVGRHNALDKLIGHSLNKKILNPKSQFIACSGRLNFELVQKVLMANIGILIGVGAPTSLAIDLANKFNITLVGFVKESSFNIYSNKDRIIIKN